TGLKRTINERPRQPVLCNVALVVVPIANSIANSPERISVVAAVEPLAPVLLAVLRVVENTRRVRRGGVAQTLTDDVGCYARVPFHDFERRFHASSTSRRVGPLAAGAEEHLTEHIERELGCLYSRFANKRCPVDAA